MSIGPITPVIPSSPSRVQQIPNRRTKLPLAALAPAAGSAPVCSVASVDCNGRILDSALLESLEWLPGLRFDVRVSAGLILLTAAEDAEHVVRRRGELRLPATIRHWCGLTTGCRVLLVAEPESERLVIHPPAALGAMLRGFHQEKLGGDAT
ncbi:hypothetical protein [Paractinoplanes toevensis]|uniref:SpoVT-AbrB domain-containing protein n=1 Tax=Paractinoplanes toevensis TaxID=571911 RepID=A0A920BQM6_9ACTN|nr:hypothetical protein [Actinoplanes toevensis]GIM96856.1 hypothetical protein Ato02nite_086490 [Actinoplanes toevensis]